ncbi:MAG: exopolysaccharide biosynthesis polyprenyl glycosylphosphotransferase [Hyphomicrobiaceae bacterium]|nr:exopolysaccharide biosynthesis polyprenyl glycosylphosphotransferase [Hyphomicrobiaceae bacterium]
MSQEPASWRLPVSPALESARSWRLIAPLLALADAVVLTTIGSATGIGYYLVAFDGIGPLGGHVALGLSIAALFVALASLERAYSYKTYVETRRRFGRVWRLWNLTFLLLFTFFFLLKAGADYSRGSSVLLYFTGLGGIALTREWLGRQVVAWSKTGRVVARRLMLVGTGEAIDDFVRRHQPWNLGLAVVAAATIDTDARDAAALDGALELARSTRPDEVMVLMPWSRSEAITRCVDQFLVIPAAIHLGPEKVLDRYEGLELVKIGRLASLSLVRAPLDHLEILTKRGFDIVAAAAGLILLAPLFAAVAVAIKLETPGPVFFRQPRFGFNRETFSIFKFRSMGVMEDGTVAFKQATKNDPRITRVGAFIRRTNIDELPQLINVLKGDMSLVGPRPHPLSLDRAYENRLSLYARRHNMKPGITGWAQVNGHRGETDTMEKMGARLEHDLFYLDNWSLLLDLRIILLTVVSRRAYRNAV